MPILSDQTLLEPTVYGSSYETAPSVPLASKADWITPGSLASDRPGTVAGGFSMADLGALSDLGNLADYSKILKPLNIPTTTFAGIGVPAGGSIRTGSLELNMLDMSASVQQASGQFIGQRTPLIGANPIAGQSPVDQALAAMGNYGTLPTKLIDYAAALPIQAIQFFTGQQYVPIKSNPDGSPVQPFQKLSDYWNALRLVTTDDQLVSMAKQVASATVGPAMVPALQAQLLAIFRSDFNSLTGLSSGNDRVDYMSKTKLQGMLDYGKFVGSNDPMASLTGQVNDKTLPALLGAASYVVGDVSKELVTSLPFGTQMAQFLEPIRSDTEAAWQKLTPQQRFDFFGNAQTEGALADFAASIPLFSGLGAAIGIARAGAAGGSLAEATTSGNSLLRMAQQAAWLIGKPGVGVPAILTKEGVAGRLLASVFGNAMPAELHITNVYDFALHATKLTMATGVGVWAVNAGLSMASPTYAAGEGKIIDNSHYIADSDAAGALNMLGLFSGGTMGASTAIKFVKSLTGKGLDLAGIEASPVNPAVSTHYGTEAPRLWSDLGVGGNLMQPAITHITSEIQRFIQNGKIAEAQTHLDAGRPERAADVLMTAAITDSQAMDMFGSLVKAANERSTGLESDAAIQTQKAVKAYARELMDTISHMMEEQNGAAAWDARLSQMTHEVTGKPLAFDPAGLREYIRQTANAFGHDGAAIVKGIDAYPEMRLTGKGARAQLQPWQRAANGMRQYAFDTLNGTLKDIVDEGTSKTAPLVFLERADSLWGDVARRYVERYNAKDEAAVEALRLRMVRTPQVLEWWAKTKTTTEGARTPDQIGAEALFHYAEQMADHLPSKRVTPGPNSAEGSLNDLQLTAEKAGYTLAYKPTETTAVGVMKAQADAAEREVVAYQVKVEQVTTAYEEARKAEAAYQTALDQKLYEKYTKPIEDRNREMSMERTRAARRGDQATVDALTKQLDDIDREYAKADTARNRARARDKQLKALREASDAAFAEQEAALKNPSRGYRVGPVTPDGYTPDFASVLKQMPGKTTRRSGFDADQLPTYEAARLEAARALDPSVGQALLHITTNLRDVMDHGLKSTDTLVAEGRGVQGIGGSNLPNGVSFLTSMKAAQAYLSRVKMAVETANGRASFEDVLAYYRNLPKTLDSEGMAIYRRLEALGPKEAMQARDVYDPITNQPALNANGNLIATRTEYAQWLKDQMATHLVEPYGDPLKVYEALSQRPGFATAYHDAVAPRTRPGEAPLTDMEKWQGILTALEDPRSSIGSAKVNPTYAAFQLLDRLLPEHVGGMVLILKDGSQFLGKTAEDVGMIRASVHPRAFTTPDHFEWGNDISEIRLNEGDVFVHRPLPEQPFADPIEHPLTSWDQLGPSTIPVSYIALRDPVTGGKTYVKSPFLDYPMNKELVDLGNQNFLASKVDGAVRGIKTWRLTDYMKGQTHRIFSTAYDVRPEQIDNFLARVMRLGYEKWSVGGSKHGQVPLGYQAVASLRAADVRAAAMESFGKIKVGDTFEPAPILNKITGKVEVPDYETMLVDGFRQAWTLNFTSALTSRFYALGSMGPQALHSALGGAGHFAMLGAQWFVPIVRYMASPIFKTSELIESKFFNAARGTKDATPEQLATYREMGMPTQIGQIASELGAGDTMAQGLMGGLPTTEEALAMHPNGLADLTDNGSGFALAKELRDVAKLRLSKESITGPARDVWDSIANPTPFKDKLAASMVVQMIGKDFARVMERVDPVAFDFYTQELKVPRAKLADYITKDRSLYQAWQNGTADWTAFTAHHSMYNPALAEPLTAEMAAFYKTEAWQATEAMFRLGAKTAQTEAFGVHYFGSYRSPIERGINHPLLGSYPASWAYKAAKEWFRFLFDNRTFGNGELRLGATPAAYIQSTVQAQAVMYAKNNPSGQYASLDDWLNHGPYAQAFFMFNLLLPGDWSNLPFPMSRSIRMALRGNVNPVDHISQNIFGPATGAPGGIGAIRDFKYATTGIQNIVDSIVNPTLTNAQKLSAGLNSDGTRPMPADFNAVTQYPTTIDLTPANDAPQR